MEKATAVLTVHRGAKKVSRQSLENLPTPVATATWTPIPHYSLVEQLSNEFANRGITIHKEEFAVQRENNLLFGVFDLNMPSSTGDFRAAYGFRTSNDRTIGLRAVAGCRVFVCDNLALSGDEIVLRRRHTSGLNIREEIVQSISRFMERYEIMNHRIDSMKEIMLGDEAAKGMIYDAFATKCLPTRLFPVVHNEYYEPSFPEFRDNGFSMWRLNNAFTFAIKNLTPNSKMESLNKVGKFFNTLVDMAV